MRMFICHHHHHHQMYRIPIQCIIIHHKVQSLVISW
jgi:hypothetical protein